MKTLGAILLVWTVGQGADERKNLDAGKKLCFVEGKWSEGLPMLSTGSDPFYAEIAKLDLVGADPMKIGDGWWDGSLKIELHVLEGATATSDLKKQGKAYRSRFVERACFWYQKAWGSADDASKKLLREKFSLALKNVKPTPPRTTAQIPDWKGFSYGQWTDLYAHGGIRSVAVPPRGKQSGVFEALRFDGKGLVPGKQYTFSYWALSDGPVGPAALSVFHPTQVVTVPPSDQPFWAEVSTTFTAEASAFSLVLAVDAKSANLYIDDVSLKEAGTNRELLQNGSFEK